MSVCLKSNIHIDSGLRMCEDENSGMGAMGDLDGDGDLDIFNAFFNNGSNSVWINDSLKPE